MVCENLNCSAQDFYPALAAVDTAAIERGQRWRRLVDANVAVVLCGNVLKTKLKNYLSILPSGSNDVRNVGPFIIYERYHDYLLHAAIKFANPPDVTDVKVITVLKRYWSMMVIRVSPGWSCDATLILTRGGTALDGPGTLAQTREAVYI